MLDDAEYDIVRAINSAVNDNIRYVADGRNERLDGLKEEWNVVFGRGNGDCDDYVMTKRHALRERYPDKTECFRIATCWDETGEYHAVLLVDAVSGTWVLDNRHPSVMQFPSMPYVWHKIQRPDGSWFEV